MGLYLLNISVDTPDPNPEYIPEDLSINDQESIVEIIIEQILGFENAIKEYDDHDTEDHDKKNNVKIELLVLQTNTNSTRRNQLPEKKEKYPDYVARLINGFKEIDSPPPQV
ncbi:hypothetical protein [Winogradskyella sp.]|uniref:hypothetical protein n=1 Tax=Winogradskyella sp. TaxID=1883156 RepID=UPI003BAC374C